MLISIIMRVNCKPALKPSVYTKQLFLRKQVCSAAAWSSPLNMRFCVTFQYANALIGDFIWNYFQTYLPHLIGDENPNNEKIRQIFGDQGGY